MIQLLEHNRIAYDSVREQLADTGKACVIHPTGTGKSFIAFKWVEDHPEGRFVWLSPSENIYETQLVNLKQASGFEPENITFMTYARLMLMSEEEIRALNPTHAVLDEFHRTGAEHWERNVRKIMECFPDMQVLGLSATPVRYLDNQRDMAEEIFDGCVADNMTLGEAIARGILPAPKYVVSLYTYDGVLESYQSRIHRSSAAVRGQAEEYLERLRRALEKSEGLDRVFARHLSRGKYLVFCSNVEHMRAMLKKVPQWFCTVDEKPNVYAVWADSASAKRDYQSFVTDGSDHLRLLFCVDMFNEGVHVKDIDGVILFRPTISPIIYKQQIGRALSAMKGGTPLIIDAVNNFENLYSISAVQAEMRQIVDFYRNNRREDEIETDTFQIIDEVRECRQLINQLEETLSLSWETMYRLAKAYYVEHGNLNMERRYRTEDGVPLGSWIATQRNVYNGNSAGILDEHRFKLLNDIGMVWDYAKDVSWENGFSHLAAYKDAFGSLDIPARHVCEDGFPLGRWVSAQRIMYMKLRNAGMDPLDDERLRRLNDLGMIWKRADVAFEEGFLEATKYATEHGNLEVPAYFVTDNGFKLGAWISRMRYRYTGYGNYVPLEEDQIRRLEDIGIQWRTKHERKWERCFAEAERYFNKNGHLNVPQNHKQNDVDLSRWIRRQCENVKAGKLTEDQRHKLEQIGFSLPTREKTWEENYEQARAYHQQYGDLEIPAQYIAPNGTWLGKWVSIQRLHHKQGKLSDEQIIKLNALSMRWEDVRTARWNANLKTASTYPRTADGVPVVPDDVMSEGGTFLSRWVQKQDKKYRQGQLAAAQRKRWEGMLKSGRQQAPCIMESKQRNRCLDEMQRTPNVAQ